MIKTFVTPSMPPVTFYLIWYIVGILSAHTIFEYRHSLEPLFLGIIIISIVSITLFFIKQKIFQLAFFLLCGLIRTGYILYSYNNYIPSQSSPAKVIDTIKTGNPSWPFCTKLEQGNYGLLIYTKRKPFCSVDEICDINPLIFKKPNYNEFCRYLFKEKSQATAFSYKFSPKILLSPSFSLSHYLQTIRDRLLSSVSKKCSYKTTALFSSLCLGNKKIFKKGLKEPKLYFRSWGIVHHLARSGLHLIIVLFIWYLLFSIIPFSYSIKTFFISCIAMLFALFSFDGISFARSLIVFFVTQILLLSQQQTHSLHMLFIVALLFLSLNPFLIFSLDFQLSFFITLLLCLFSLVNRQKRVICCKLLLSDYKNA